MKTDYKLLYTFVQNRRFLSPQLLKPFILSFLFLAVFWPMLTGLFTAWDIKPQCSHGYIIFPISLWLFWQRKDLIESVVLKGSSAGIFLLLFGLIIYLLSYLSSISTFMNISFMISLAGLIISIYGFSVFKIFIFPYLFLLFMFPIPDGIYVDFFNRSVPSPAGPALLAKRVEVPVIPAYIYRDKNNHHHISVLPEIKLRKEDDHDTFMAVNTQLLIDWIAEILLKHPTEWLWLHNRWKRAKIQDEV